jgi:hypothetical protein
MVEETLGEKIERRLANGEGQPTTPPKFTFPCPVCKQDLSGECYQIVTPQGVLGVFPLRCPNPECMAQLTINVGKTVEIPRIKFEREKRK